MENFIYPEPLPPPPSLEYVESISEFKSPLSSLLSSLGSERVREGLSDGQIEGYSYTLRLPHAREGKHAVVGILQLTNPEGGIFTCAIRNRPEIIKGYIETVSQIPSLVDYLPQYYGTYGEWVAMECLEGLELGELTDRLEKDSNFQQKYGIEAGSALRSIADSGGDFNDVKFIDGHNVIVDPNTAIPRIIEQDALQKSQYLRPHEVLTGQLRSEILQYKPSDGVGRLVVLLTMAHTAIAAISDEELYIRARVVSPAHPSFPVAYYLQNWEELTPELHRQYLDHPDRDQLHCNLPGYTGITQALSAKLLSAIRANDIEKFGELLKQGDVMEGITEPNDPRYGVESLAVP
jgi:hypothetical protein